MGDSFLFSFPPSEEIEERTKHSLTSTTDINPSPTTLYLHSAVIPPKATIMHPYTSITTLLSVVAVAISPVASFVQPNPVSGFTVTRLNLENHIADM